MIKMFKKVIILILNLNFVEFKFLLIGKILKNIIFKARNTISRDNIKFLYFLTILPRGDKIKYYFGVIIYTELALRAH